jgi:hypothetical protein
MTTTLTTSTNDLALIDNAIDDGCHPVVYRGVLRFVYVNSGAMEEDITRSLNLSHAWTRDSVDLLLELGLVSRFQSEARTELNTNAVGMTRIGRQYVESEFGMFFQPFAKRVSPKILHKMLSQLPLQHIFTGDNLTIDDLFLHPDYEQRVEHVVSHDAENGPVRYLLDSRKRHKSDPVDEQYFSSVQVARGVYKLPPVDQHRTLLRANGFNDMVKVAYDIATSGL